MENRRATITDLLQDLDKPGAQVDGVFDVYLTPLYGELLAYARCRCPAEADDIVQNTLLKFCRLVLDQPEKLAAEAPIDFWLMRQCSYYIEDWRRRKRPVFLAEVGEPVCEGGFDGVLGQMAAEIVRGCLCQLPEMGQKAIKLWLAGMPVREAAKQLGTSKTSLNDRMIRWFHSIEACLLRKGWDDLQS